MTTEAKAVHAVEDEGGYATTEEIRKNLLGFMTAVTRATGWPAVKGDSLPKCGHTGRSARGRSPNGGSVLY